MHPFTPFHDGARALHGRALRGQSDTPEKRLALAVHTGDRRVDAAGHAAVLWLVLRGRIEVRAQEGDFVLAPRDWIALDRDSSPHAVLGRGAVLLAVGMGAEAQRGLRAESRPMLFPCRGRMPCGARAVAVRLWHAQGVLSARNALVTPAGEGAVLGFLSALQAELVEGVRRCPGHSERRKRQVWSRMQRARMCLEGQAGSGVRIAELAKRTNFSPWYFSKVFHALYGIGPLQFAARMRLEQASRLLATTRLPVTEVSAACGFDNPCSFARAFRARFGMTASEHRVRHTRNGGDPRDAGMRNPCTDASARLARGAR